VLLIIQCVQLTIKGVLLIIQDVLLIKQSLLLILVSRARVHIIGPLVHDGSGKLCERPESRTSEDVSDAHPVKVVPQKFGTE
jgi:hypothetical protein